MSAKTIKTKPFLLATAGSTVDGRTIDDKMLKEMAESYNPKTYGARLNIEHIRGFSGDGPFNSYGDVLSLSTQEVELDFNGTKEKRLALFGDFAVLDNAKKLNDAGQKVYPSIEIEPNFGGKGHAYLMGCALTDSPASIGTDRLTFNRQVPGRLNLTGDQAAALEFLEEALPPTPAADGFFAAMTDFLKKFTGTAPKDEPKPEAVPAATPDAAAFGALMTEFARKVDEAFTSYAASTSAAFTALSDKFDKLSSEVETTAKPGTEQRPQATGQTGTIDLNKFC